MLAVAALALALAGMLHILLQFNVEALVVCSIGGALVGWLLDNAQGTTHWTGICVMIGAAGGLVLGLLILNRTSRNGS